MTSILLRRRRALAPFGFALPFACSVYESPPSHDAATAGQAGNSEAPRDGGGTSANGAGKAGSGAGATSTLGGAPGEGGGAGTDTALAGTSGGGASSSAGASPGESGGGAGPEPERVLELLDDMEDGDAFVVTSKGRNGHWDVSNDATGSATQTPPAAAFTMAELAATSRPDSHFSAYTRGAGFKDWGAYMTVSMRTWPKYEETPVYDASAYAGISFYAKVGVGSDATVRVRYIGAQTDPRGGQCTPGGTIDVACYDHFFAQLKLTPDWQRVDLLFRDFQQSGVGKSFPSINLTGMYALEFFFPGRKTATGNAFELWVDDLSFIAR